MAQDTSAHEEFWPKVNVFVNMNKSSRVLFEYSATRQDNLGTYSDGVTGGYFDFYMLPIARRKLREHPDAARHKLLMFRAGYLFTLTPGTSSKGKSTEHTPVLELHTKLPMPGGLLLTDRNRGDLRFVDGVFEPRYRNRLKLERSCLWGRLHLTPYVHAEAFLDTRWNEFNRYRYSAGADVVISRRMVLDAYYLRQHDRKSTPYDVNAIGATLEFHLR